MHLARAGWIRWRDEVPTLPRRSRGTSRRWRPGSHLDDGSGLDITEAGTQKRLAIYVVRDPHDVPGIARLGPDPLDDDFTIDVLGRDPPGRRPRPGQGRAARTRARSPASATPTPTSCCTPPGCRRSSRPRSVDRRRPADRCTTRSARVLGDAVERSARAGRRPSSRARRRATSPCTAAPACRARCAVTPCARCPSPTPSLQYCPTCQTGGKPLADRRMSRLLK